MSLPMSPRVGATPAAALGDWTHVDPLAVCIPDLTRPLDPRPALEAVLPRLGKGAPVVVGLGLHRPMTPAEMAPLAAFGALQSDSDDVLPTAVVEGIPGQVSRVVGEGPGALSIGVAELHQYAGLSGGHKGVSVGCGGRATIAALHHRDRVLHPDIQIGRLVGNPFRRAVDLLGVAAGCMAALVYVPAAGCWLFGEPSAVLAAAVDRIDPWQRVKGTWPGAVLGVPRAKAQSFYQASRALTYLALSPHPPVDRGGTLVLHAPCPEGLGSEGGFGAALAGGPPPWSHVLTGPPPQGAGAQRAVMVALAARGFRLQVRGCENPGPLRRVGIDARADPPPTGPAWLDIPSPFSRLPQRA